MTAPNACPVCDGSGVAWVDDVLEPCEACDGTGRAVRALPHVNDGGGDDE